MADTNIQAMFSEMPNSLAIALKASVSLQNSVFNSEDQASNSATKASAAEVQYTSMCAKQIDEVTTELQTYTTGSKSGDKSAQGHITTLQTQFSSDVQNETSGTQQLQTGVQTVQTTMSVLNSAIKSLAQVVNIPYQVIQACTQAISRVAG